MCAHTVCCGRLELPRLAFASRSVAARLAGLRGLRGAVQLIAYSSEGSLPLARENSWRVSQSLHETNVANPINHWLAIRPDQPLVGNQTRSTIG